MWAGHKKSENIQGLHQHQDVIPQLNEQSYEKEKKRKKKKEEELEMSIMDNI